MLSSISQNGSAVPEIAVLVSTYQRPHHLQRCLLSIACQRHIEPHQLEIVVTDDGSTDETPEVVRRFADSAPFTVRFTTHPHVTFQLARCRNEGVAASTAPYLLFLDGDCLLPPDHIYQHLLRRQPHTAQAGYCCHFDRQTTAEITESTIRTGAFVQRAPRTAHAKLRIMDYKARWYAAWHHPLKPKLFGGNVGIWRSDYESVNGYDEEFEGWGCEDDDLRLRLRAAGIRIRSILRWTCTYHLWHPPAESTPPTWKDGANVAYLNRADRPVRCRRGLSHHLQAAEALT